MKSAFLVLFFFLPISLYSQKRTINYIDKKIGKTDFTYSKIDDLDRNKTIYSVSMVFNNEKYSKISDTRAITIISKQELDLFIKDLQKCFKLMFEKEQGDFSFERSSYRLTLYNSSPDLLLSDTRPGLTSGGTFLKKIDVVELLETLSTIRFGTNLLSSPKSIQEQIK